MDSPISWGILVVIVFLLFIRSIKTYDADVSKNKNDNDRFFGIQKTKSRK